MSDDPITGLHRRFDKLESNFEEVKAEQHDISKKVDRVDHRVDLLEVQIAAAEKRETMVVQTINEKLEHNTGLIQRLFEKYEQHTESEANDRKKLLFWLVSCVVSVVGTASVILFSRVFGA